MWVNEDFKVFDNKYLTLSRHRNDKVLGIGFSCYYSYWGDRPSIKPTTLFFNNTTSTYQ